MVLFALVCFLLVALALFFLTLWLGFGCGCRLSSGIKSGAGVVCGVVDVASLLLLDLLGSWADHGLRRRPTGHLSHSHQKTLTKDSYFNS